MTKNRLLLWTLLIPAVYWALATVVDASFFRLIGSAALTAFSGAVGGRLARETFRIVVQGKRSPDPDDSGSHWAVVGGFFQAVGAFWTAIYGASFVLAGQPISWLALPVGPFGPVTMAFGFCLTYLAPDVTPTGLKPTSRLIIFVLAIVAAVAVFAAGMKFGEWRTGTASLPFSISQAGASCPRDRPIKGNHASSGARIYHMPGGSYYERTVPEACFGSSFSARIAGYRPSG